MNSKYPTTQGRYCYCHIIPNGLIYIGRSGQQPCNRWKPSNYKTTSLQPYIIQYGWDNIQHIVLKDGLTKEQAKELEGLLIEEAKKGGWCINKKESGNETIAKERRRKYKHNYNQLPENKEKQREYRQRPEVKERRREYDRNRYQNDPEYKEHQREYQRNRWQNDPEYRERLRKYNREWKRQYRLKKKSLNLS